MSVCLFFLLFAGIYHHEAEQRGIGAVAGQDAAAAGDGSGQASKAQRAPSGLVHGGESVRHGVDA